MAVFFSLFFPRVVDVSFPRRYNGTAEAGRQEEKQVAGPSPHRTYAGMFERR